MKCAPEYYSRAASGSQGVDLGHIFSKYTPNGVSLKEYLPSIVLFIVLVPRVRVSNQIGCSPREYARMFTHSTQRGTLVIIKVAGGTGAPLRIVAVIPQ